MKAFTFALNSMLAPMLALALTAGAASSVQAAPDADRKAKMEQRAAARMAQIDTNGDGNISREEAMAQAMKRFDKMDLNGDGQITPQERQEAKAKFKGERKMHKRTRQPAS